MLDEQEFVLSYLAEECNEVAQLADKAVKFGIECDYIAPNHLRERLMEELCDLLGVVSMLGSYGIISHPLSQEAMDQKVKKVEKFMKYAQERGRLKRE